MLGMCIMLVTEFLFVYSVRGPSGLTTYAGGGGANALKRLESLLFFGVDSHFGGFVDVPNPAAELHAVDSLWLSDCILGFQCRCV